MGAGGGSGSGGENMSNLGSGMSLAPGLGPWGAKASDRTGQGRVGVVTSTSTQLSRLLGERGRMRCDG